MARLDVLSGVQDTQSFSLLDDVEVGRSPTSTICLPDHQVSRHHARITCHGDNFVIEDLQSTNGVRLRGKQIPAGVPCELHDGDEVGIGSALFVFRLDDTALETPPQEAAPEVHHQPTQESASQWSVQKDFGMLTVTPVQEDIAHQSIALALDASTDMAVLEAHENQISQSVHEALRRLRAMCQVSATLGMITERELLLGKIVECIFDIFPGADRLCMMLRERGSEVLVPVMARKRHEAAGQHEEMVVSRSIVQEVVTRKRAILSFDAMGDKRFSHNASVINLSIRSMMCAPLVAADDLLGLIQVDSNTGPNMFTSEDLQILTGISAQAAITIKNMQLYEAVQTETARRTSLQRYFSPGLVDLLMSGNLSTTLGGSAYRGTILFSDIIGFTSLSEALAPTEVVTQLNRYFSIMQRLIYEQRGNVDKLNGDSIMAFWGVPYNEPDDERNAVLAAMRMQQHLWFFNQTLMAEKKPPIHMGIGINTGEFIAGNIGSEDKIEFTLIGDTVNLAARLEGLSGRYQILIAETTWQAFKQDLCAVRLPPVVVKGKSTPVTIYSVRGVYDSSRDECLMMLPCEIFDAEGQQEVGKGILTSMSLNEAGSSRQMQVHTDCPLTPGTTYVLHLGLVEYHELVRVFATVASVSSALEAMATPGTTAVLTVTGETAVLESLMPGKCLVTAYPWEQLKRV